MFEKLKIEWFGAAFGRLSDKLFMGECQPMENDEMKDSTAGSEWWMSWNRWNERVAEIEKIIYDYKTIIIHVGLRWSAIKGGVNGSLLVHFRSDDASCQEIDKTQVEMASSQKWHQTNELRKLVRMREAGKIWWMHNSLNFIGRLLVFWVASVFCDNSFQKKAKRLAEWKGVWSHVVKHPSANQTINSSKWPEKSEKRVGELHQLKEERQFNKN